MDPNKTLARLREWMNAVENDPAQNQSEAEASQLFLALDRWLTRGGVAPEGWRVDQDMFGLSRGEAETLVRLACTVANEYDGFPEVGSSYRRALESFSAPDEVHDLAAHTWPVIAQNL